MIDGSIRRVQRRLAIVLLMLFAAAFAFAAVPGTSGEESVRVGVRTLAKLGRAHGGGIVGLAYGERALWAAFSTRRVHRIDPRTGVATPVTGTSGAIGVAAGEGAVWAQQDGAGVDPDNGEPRSNLLRIDPASLDVTDRVALKASALQIATGGGRVWVMLADAIAEIDPDDGRVRRRLRAEGVETILSTRDALWKVSYVKVIEKLGPDSTVQSSTPTVTKLDLASGRVLQRTVLEGSAGELGADGGRIIALNAGSSGMYRIDGKAGKSATSASATSAPRAVRAVWRATGRKRGSSAFAKSEERCRPRGICAGLRSPSGCCCGAARRLRAAAPTWRSVTAPCS